VKHILLLLVISTAKLPLSVTYMPQRGATVLALNRKSVKKIEEFPITLYWVSLATAVSHTQGHSIQHYYVKIMAGRRTPTSKFYNLCC